MPQLQVNIAPDHPHGLVLKNPVMVASGTFGYGTEYASIYDVNQLGAIVSKGITRKPRAGNPMPRIAEVPGGMLNAIGLQNIGVEAVVRDKAPIWATWQVPVIVNISGEAVDDYVYIAQTLDGVPGVAGLELNISCPNVANGLLFGVDAGLAAEVTQAVVESCSLPVIVKLTPNVTDIRPIARAVADAGAHALSVMNTLTGMTIDLKRRRPALANITGGLSGPAVRSIALYLVYQVAQEVDIPILGIGGISSTEDALMFFMAGATAVQVGTANFFNHLAPLQISAGLEQYLEREGIADLHEIIGVALPAEARSRRRTHRARLSKVR